MYVWKWWLESEYVFLAFRVAHRKKSFIVILIKPDAYAPIAQKNKTLVRFHNKGTLGSEWMYAVFGLLGYLHNVNSEYKK